MKMTMQEAFDIILNDEDYLDLTKWTKKHFVSQRMYNLYVGLTPRESRIQIRTIKRAIKHLKKVKKEYEKRGIPIPGSVGSSPKDEKRVHTKWIDGIRQE